jgi:isopentenyldiphosphate isomerase
MIRGAYEEIKLSTNVDELEVREKEFCTRKNAFRQIYFLVCTEQQKMNLVPRPGEVQEIKWVSLPELKKMMQEDPSMYSESLPEILPYREQYKQDLIETFQAKKPSE